MLRRLLRREGQFLELFNAHAARIVEGSRELAMMLGGFTELEAHAQRIDTAERAADKITHEVVKLLHQGFRTPESDADRCEDAANVIEGIALERS